MIALPQRLPYVIWKQDRLLPLSEAWLAESIRRGALQAGYPGWDIGFHVAHAIAVFLEEEFNATTITVTQLEEMLAKSIEKIGYQDVAKTTALIAPRVSISLAEIADQTHYELLFYPRLRERLDEAMALEAGGVIFGDLKPCVKILDQASRWRQTCEELRNQIVQYIREYLALDAGRSLEFAIV